MTIETQELKRRWPRAEALVVASELVAAMQPGCSRIVIAGSIRRERPTVGDVEILYVPSITEDPDREDMFRTRKFNLADEIIEQLEGSGVLARRKNKLGSEMFGPKNKLMVHVPSGIPVDLFSTTEENWWVSLVVRTGSKETNLRLTTGAIKLGRTLKAYGPGVEMIDPHTIDGSFYRAGEMIHATSERDVFRLCGVEYLEPNQR